MKQQIKYFDYNATHPPLPGLLQKYLDEYETEFYNPSGPTRFSLKRQGRLEEARKTLGKLTGCDPKGFVFCSTGTEANYLLSFWAKKFCSSIAYVSPLEHSSFYSALEAVGISYTLLKTDKTGQIDPDEVRKRFIEQPGPVFSLHAANETGVLQPLEQIGSICQEFGQKLYSDLMQSFAKVSVPFSSLNGFTFSGHKLGAGMGASAVWFSPKERKEAGWFQGGNQENGSRAGTENSPAILALVEASEIQFQEMERKNQRLLEFRNRIENSLKELGASIVAENSPRLPSTTFCLLPTDDLDFFMVGMEERGFALSTGSSCKSRSREPAKSLLAMGYTQEEALRAIRISTGMFTTPNEVEDLISAISEVLRLL
ncbi:cysteine desulfurase [Leptospira perolatii]|uniref:Cysteine desulfurase n=1 Tax=Leptospira perolatii TaxID=2023191 RepID=A0A2M9ZMU0_9LEPT|nr:aminotransferase class V-fold PLP-dependent enzyme [Leptospira perolatii]PJZ68284.1 cysteine desulfurase [Leptospira perolatii]PJZ73365.1 cysteine desulfurase [Leptospira perolatii]